MTAEQTRATPRVVPTNGGSEYVDDQPGYLDNDPPQGQPRNLRCPECHQRVTRITGLHDDGTAKVGPCGHRIPVEVTLG